MKHAEYIIKIWTAYYFIMENIKRNDNLMDIFSK